MENFFLTNLNKPLSNAALHWKTNLFSNGRVGLYPVFVSLEYEGSRHCC